MEDLLYSLGKFISESTNTCPIENHMACVFPNRLGEYCNPGDCMGRKFKEYYEQYMKLSDKEKVRLANENGNRSDVLSQTECDSGLLEDAV